VTDRVTIFQIEHDLAEDRLQTLALDGDDSYGFPYIRLMSEPNTVMERWTTPAVYVDRPTREQPDFFHLWGGGASFVLGTTVPEDVRETLRISGELLPVSLDGVELEYLHVTEVCNVVDRSKTEWDDEIDEISDALAFFVHRLPEVPVFRVPENNAAELFCSQGYGEFDFKALVEARGLSGLTFREAWNSESGAIRKVWNW
jgi:hypothetical protein